MIAFRPQLLAIILWLTSPLLWAANTTSSTESTPSVYHAAILIYHHVSDQSPPSTSVSPERFRAHLDLLEDQGYTVWSLQKVMQAISQRQPMPDKVVALTFDDGYEDVYQNAWPLLKRRQLPFTVFVSGAYINQHPLYLTWEQLKEMQDSGLMTAGNHTASHPHMIRRKEDESQADWLKRMQREINLNQSLIQKFLGTTTPFFAFPYGESTPELEQLVRQMGYLGFGQQTGVASLYTGLSLIPRIAANGLYSNPSTLVTKLHSLPLPVKNVQPASGVLKADQTRPELTFDLYPGEYDPNQLRCYGGDGHEIDTQHQALKAGGYRVKVITDRDLSPGRTRYNCTAPSQQQARYFWFSKQWMLPQANSQWYQER